MEVEFKLQFDWAHDNYLDYRKKHLAIGSCFAENIGRKLIINRFDVLINPFGTLYNPISIGEVISQSEDDLTNSVFESNEIWFSWKAGTKVNGLSREEALNTLLGKQLAVKKMLNEGQAVLVTFGSAWVYELDGQLVANCHKRKTSDFTKRLLTVNEIVQKWEEILTKHASNRFIFSVSPVRYTRDGLHESNVSKGVLHQAIHELIRQYANASYFPAYEIVMDELRDYRFYDKDLVHPNELAVDYVWSKFQNHVLSDESLEMVNEYQRIVKMANHKLMFPQSAKAQKFITRLNAEKTAFENRFFANKDVISAS